MLLRTLSILLVVFVTSCNQTSTVGQNGDSGNRSHTEVSTLSHVKSRTFRFVYGATLTELEPGAHVRIWLPVPISNHDQDVELSGTNLPAEYKRTRESGFGNELIYLEARANDDGEVPLEVSYVVTRRELTKDNYETATGSGEAFLTASSLVPTGDELRKQVLGDVQSDWQPIRIARELYERVESHMNYDKPADKPGWGNGDARWACDNRFGNCTDFHSLFISAARNLKIPARFEIGFSIPQEIGEGEVGGYHCWAKFLANKQWIPVDISEADKHPELKDYYFGSLTADRVVFSTGRDLKLEPSPAAGAVNYLAYPYAEVDGKQHTSFRKAFRYQDVDSQ